jgi:neutral ceramidase
MKRAPPHRAGPAQRRVLRVGAGLLALALLAAPLAGAGLQAGATQVDITPPPGLEMYGFFNRIKEHQVATGTLDPLYARVLVLQADQRRLALVTLDLGRTFNEAWLERLRAAVRADSRVDALIVVASHTHSGPNILDVYPEGRPPAWEDATLEKVARAVHDAAQGLEPARLGTGYGNVSIGYNRRRVDPSGGVSMMWSNPEKVANGPVDSTVGVIRVDRADGSPIAILVNHACHPTVLGSDNLQYSSDFIGPMAATVAAAFGGRPVCFFLQGAAGDINPYFDGTPIGKGGLERRDWTGRELGTEAARVAKEIKTADAASSSIDFADDVMVFPWRWDPQRFHDDLLRVDGPLVFRDHADILEAATPPTELALHVTTLLINRQIGVIGMPGEPFVDFQESWRDRCPVRACFFLGYANGYYDYFPTIRAASQGGYGAADSNTYVAVGAGERMLDHALIRMHRMLGQLSGVPLNQSGAPPLHAP